MHEKLNARIAFLLDGLASAVAAHGFEAVRTAVSDWQDGAADDEDRPDWHELLAGRLRAALDLCEAADDCRDTCHVSLAWSDACGAVEFVFPATGAGPRLMPAVVRAAARAAGGDPFRAYTAGDDLLCLFLPVTSRRWRVAQYSGEMFAPGDDFAGWTLQVELDHDAQADAVARAIRQANGHWQESPDTVEGVTQ
jgi:hypothetical protein